MPYMPASAAVASRHAPELSTTLGSAPSSSSSCAMGSMDSHGISQALSCLIGLPHTCSGGPDRPPGVTQILVTATMRGVAFVTVACTSTGRWPPSTRKRTISLWPASACLRRQHACVSASDDLIQILVAGRRPGSCKHTQLTDHPKATPHSVSLFDLSSN